MANMYIKQITVFNKLMDEKFNNNSASIQNISKLSLSEVHIYTNA